MHCFLTTCRTPKNSGIHTNWPWFMEYQISRLRFSETQDTRSLLQVLAWLTVGPTKKPKEKVLESKKCSDFFLLRLCSKTTYVHMTTLILSGDD